MELCEGNIEGLCCSLLVDIAKIVVSLDRERDVLCTIVLITNINTL